jgi:hypothetical protein
MAQSAVVFSHWFHMLEGLQESPKTFYESLEGAIKKRELPDVKTSRIEYGEGGMFAAKREYFRVKRGTYTFDMCAAPFGRGFFVSWWLGETRPAAIGPTLLALVLIAALIIFTGVIIGLVVFVALFLFLGAVAASEASEWSSYILVIPLIGFLFEHLFMPTTYYRRDTTLMFQESVHAAVLETVDGLTQAKGMRALSESERKPTLSNLFK